MKKKRPHGEMRPSQLLMGYGPGAMIDLPHQAVMIGGLDHWKGDMVEIVESRLQEKVDRFLETSGVRLLAPPVETESDPKTRSGIGSQIFPIWFIALHDQLSPSGVRSRPLVPRKELRNGEYLAPDKKTHKVVPVRWVQACPGGHCSDIDWDGFVHEYSKRCNRPLWLDEHGTSGDLAEIEVRCECGVRRSLARATKIGERPLGNCTGARPWIGPAAKDPCQEPARLLVRTATDTYFSQTLSVISIPDPDQKLRDAVDEVWTDFLEPLIEKLGDVARARKMPKVKAALADLTDIQVFAEVQRRRKPTKTPSRGVKEVEAEVFLGSDEEMGDDVPLVSKFFARSLPDAEISPNLRGHIGRIVLVHRLREVIAQVGFTRFEAETVELDDEELNIGVRRAALADEMKWVPAIENRGEGVFVAFKPETIDKWLKRSPVVERGKLLQRGYDAWQARRRHGKPNFPGMPYYLLHSVSHLLITAVSLDCGYSASSIRERVYATGPNYGILLYTGTSDAEGTLGGLVQAGRRICDHLASAMELGQLCSNDPVCSQHEPDDPHEERFLHGASCHGCLLISETSCERRNEFLDRTLVIPTVLGLGAEYFERP